MLVKELADRFNVSAETVRYYTRIGLLEPRRLDNGYHAYSAADQETLRFCLRAKQLGFGLADIQLLRDVARRGESPCNAARQILQRNITRARAELAQQQALLQRMETASVTWEELPDSLPGHENICALIEQSAEGLAEHLTLVQH